MTEQQTLWELIAYVDGHNRANGKVEPPTEAEFDQMLKTHNVTVN